MNESVGVAKGHINDLEEILADKEFRGPEWDLHRQLLRAAHNTTNGGAGDPRVIGENVAMLTATYVQDRIRQPEQIKRAFAELHGDICPVVPLVRAGSDGKPVMPWEAGERSWLSSALSIEIGGKKINATGPITFVICAMIFIGGLKWVNGNVSSEVKAAVNNAIKAQIVNAVQDAAKGEAE